MPLSRGKITPLQVEALKQELTETSKEVGFIAQVLSDKTPEQIQEYIEIMATLPQSIQDLNALIQTAEEEKIEVRNKIQQLTGQINGLNTTVGDLTLQTQNQAQTAANQADTITALQAALQSQGVDIAQFQTVINNLTDQNLALQQSNSDLNNQITQINQLVASATETVESIYEDESPAQ